MVAVLVAGSAVMAVAEAAPVEKVVRAEVEELDPNDLRSKHRWSIDSHNQHH